MLDGRFGYPRISAEWQKRILEAEARTKDHGDLSLFHEILDNNPGDDVLTYLLRFTTEHTDRSVIWERVLSATQSPDVLSILAYKDFKNDPRLLTKIENLDQPYTPRSIGVNLAKVAARFGMPGIPAIQNLCELYSPVAVYTAAMHGAATTEGPDSELVHWILQQSQSSLVIGALAFVIASSAETDRAKMIDFLNKHRDAYVWSEAARGVGQCTVRDLDLYQWIADHTSEKSVLDEIIRGTFYQGERGMQMARDIVLKYPYTDLHCTFAMQAIYAELSIGIPALDWVFEKFPTKEVLMVAAHATSNIWDNTFARLEWLRDQSPPTEVWVEAAGLIDDGSEQAPAVLEYILAQTQEPSVIVALGGAASKLGEAAFPFLERLYAIFPDPTLLAEVVRNAHRIKKEFPNIDWALSRSSAEIVLKNVTHIFVMNTEIDRLESLRKGYPGSSVIHFAASVVGENIIYDMSFVLQWIWDSSHEISHISHVRKIGRLHFEPRSPGTPERWEGEMKSWAIDNQIDWNEVLKLSDQPE